MTGTFDGGDGNVVGTVDEDGDSLAFVLADLDRKGAWLSMAAEDAPNLSAWR